MAHRHAVEAVDRSLRDVYTGQEEEHGVPTCLMLAIHDFGGDFQQILPVVRGSNLWCGAQTC
eukprot:64697-Chlamydomonas_euryale.AAC.1